MTQQTPKALDPSKPAAASDESQEGTSQFQVPTDLHTFARQRMSADILGLDPRTMKPDRHYRWVRNDSQSITKARLWGYQLVDGKGGEKTIVQADRGADGAIRRGDLVLMWVPKQVHDHYVRAKHARSEKLLASTAADTEEQARKKGIKVIKDSDHGQETMESR